MFTKILLPLDGSELAEKALPYGIELGEKLSSELILFHVCGNEHQQYKRMHQLYLDRLAELMTNDVNKDNLDNKIKVSTYIESGEPYENICRFIDKNGVNLIVMTTVGASGIKAGSFGSIADRMCRTIPVPILLVKPQSLPQTNNKERLINHVLVPLDGSSLSKLALPWAEQLAARLGLEITLFQMAQIIRPYVTSDTIESIDYTKLGEVEEKRVTAEMEVLVKELADKGLRANIKVTSGYDGAVEIIDTVKKIGADLIVMSTHGRSGLGRWVYGSVAAKVMHAGDKPILLINARTG